MARHISILITVVVAGFILLSFTTSGLGTIRSAPNVIHDADIPRDANSQGTADFGALSGSILEGGSIAPKLENATAKAELGRASWKLFHTMMARFPEKPTEDDSLALKTYIQLFARLYPCGDCASHFQKLIKKFPPQIGSRNSAAGWACHVHNQVNERLEKPIFDCNNIGDFYDCGCGEDKKKTGEAETRDPTLDKE
ncbi:putative FAD-linked sulfhydryl oxidase ALR [Rosellinia necatrix]|uniref:Sulfhydryl oxidase n=1 Tax=Rosellinia necatrix TaxID=77044 RepID=A0A1W2TFQ6_ROSNE|nr:putative FAD-linked sulfhydryl oxidase ALR [Rosellinia necatrix]